MDYDKNSFLAGLSVGRTLKGWAFGGSGQSGGHGVGVESKDIDFMDYDGTILYSYTLNEIQNVQGLPPAPQHDGLIFDKWGWTIQEIKNLGRKMTVGAYYNTNDGATKIHISLPIPASLRFGVRSADVVIDWGDGNSEAFINSSSSTIKYISHMYSDSARYIVSISGTCEIVYMQFDQWGDGSYWRHPYVTEINFEDSCSFNSQATRDLPSLQFVSFPSTFQVNSSQFNGCSGLRSICFPLLLTYAGEMFYGASSLRRVATLPSTVFLRPTNIFRDCINLERFDGHAPLSEGSAMRNCKNLRYLGPAYVTKIGEYALSGCLSLPTLYLGQNIREIGNNAINIYGRESSLSELHLASETPPTIKDSNILSYDKALHYKIFVPQQSVDAYKSDSNWSKYADHIFAETEQWS